MRINKDRITIYVQRVFQQRIACRFLWLSLRFNIVFFIVMVFVQKDENGTKMNLNFIILLIHVVSIEMEVCFRIHVQDGVRASAYSAKIIGTWLLNRKKKCKYSASKCVHHLYATSFPNIILATPTLTTKIGLVTDFRPPARNQRTS